jgi:putative ABC transport system permease protein
VATAVIVGALVVGESMRESLRALTVERLGRIETVIVPGGFFVASDVAPSECAALMYFPSAMVEFVPASPSSDRPIVRRASSVSAIGIDQEFWALDVTGLDTMPVPGDDEVILNESLASELGVQKGDLVTVRLPTEGAVPADSPLGRRDATSEGLPRMRISQVIPDRGLGRFALTPDQAAPKNVFLNRETIAQVLDRNGQANALLFDRKVTVQCGEGQGSSSGDGVVHVGLDRLGLKWQTVAQVFSDDSGSQTIFQYDQLTSERLLLPSAAVEALSPRGDTSAHPVMTYLANAIERLDESGNVAATVPYSIVTAIDSSETLPLDFDRDAQARSEVEFDSAIPMVVNSWTADRLGAKVGTVLRVAYYEPEVEDGNEIERYFNCIVTQIVPITRPAKPYDRRRAAQFDQPPTIYNDPHLTPTVPGVTDQASISDWDLPFPLKRKIDPEDDDYWNRYRLTPKVFFRLQDGQRLFGSRFGNVTSLRFPTGVLSEEDILKRLNPRLNDLGWSPMPIREGQMAASSGTTPFDGLFLALSSFVIFSAILLIVMLIRLSLQTRLRQLGVLSAVGWSVTRITRMLLAESVLLCGLGSILGGGLGIVYGKMILAGLTTWWVGAVTVPFLEFYASPITLLSGVFIGFLISILTVGWICRRIGRRDPRELLTGRDDESSVGSSRSRTVTRWVLISLVVVAIALMIMGGTQGGAKAAGGLVGGGMMILVASVMAIHQNLSQRSVSTDADSIQTRSFQTRSLAKLAQTNAARSPLRSTLAIALMAVASFLIIAMTAFALRPTDGGTGGFEGIGTTSSPIYKDISDRKVQKSFLGPDSESMAKVTIEPFRRRLGQDASCNNLYRANAPTILGVRPRFAKSDRSIDFDWASHEAIDEGESVWSLLQSSASGSADEPIPVVIDQNTAMWALGMTGGVGQIKAFEYDQQTLHFRVVGLLAGSVLQGSLMIGEDNFTRSFPAISGYSFFLIDTASSASIDQVAEVMESRFSDVGMDIQPSHDVLAALLAVQNTYLRTFQSLGALGLLLGTVGLAVAQWRSVLQRRGELAVMRAVGFTQRRLAGLVIGETVSLLVLGIGCGLLCALSGVIPIWIGGGAPADVWGPVTSVFGILVFGIAVALVVALGVLRMPLIESLRSED